METTSATLLDRVRQRGDTAAWHKFVNLYTPFLYHCCRRMGLSETEAPDCVQEVFIVLLAKLPEFQYQKEGSFRAWLRTVTVNKCRERYRGRKEQALGGTDGGLSQLAESGMADALWDTEYRQHLLARALEIMQAEFETTTWQACWQTIVQDRPASQVAVELGMTVNAVYVARSRVMRKLRDEMGELLDV